ncbi:glycoside hydrolase domain-containing protein, partial [Candidatus Omnitrophota bacterium]
IDIWCPHVADFSEDKAEREKLKGKEVWWYVSSQRAGIPGFNIDISVVDNRILFWMNWKYKIAGVLYWCVNRWPHNPWDDAMIYRNQNGNGSLLYPGKNGPVDSIRLEAIRDGIEDYEYFYLLNGYKEVLKEKNARSPHIKAIEKLLAIEEDIILSPSSYTQDQTKLLKKREEVARKIEQVRKLLQ